MHKIEVYIDEVQGEIITQGFANGADYWLGATDAKQEGAFIWDHTGYTLNFTAWGEQQPDGSSSENCLAATEEHFYFW